MDFFSLQIKDYTYKRLSNADLSRTFVLYAANLSAVTSIRTSIVGATTISVCVWIVMPTCYKKWNRFNQKYKNLPLLPVGDV